MPISDSHQIQTVFAYKTGDGQKFHDLAEAQIHTRKSLLGMQYDKLCKEDPNFAKMDRGLFVEATFKAGTLIGEIMRDTLSPKAPVGLHQGGIVDAAAAPRIIDKATPALRQISERVAEGSRTTGIPADKIPPIGKPPLAMEATESAAMQALRELSERDQAGRIMTNTPRAGEPADARARMAQADVDEAALEAELEASLNEATATKE